jgi:hypothetical protein
LVLEHADGLDSLNGVGVLDEAVASGLSLAILADFGRHDAASEPEDLAKLLIVHGEGQLQQKTNSINHFGL